MKKIFIDGEAGTTGLKIYQRLENRKDIELLRIDNAKRKDLNERKKLINESDVTFLCLPDEAAKESVALCENPDTVIIDNSTAHRVDEDFAYGFIELNNGNKEIIRSSKRISNVGCHAVGFISIVNPLVKTGLLPKDYPFFCHSITGYSGGGKSMIADYENKNRGNEYKSPRQYGLNLNHKHLKEMKKHTRISYNPFFNPILGDFYSGMCMSLPIHKRLIDSNLDDIYEALAIYYDTSKFIKVTKGIEIFQDGKINPEYNSGKDSMEIFVYGNEDFIEVSALYDNLGKGASGSSIQILNTVLGVEETMGLIL